MACPQIVVRGFGSFGGVEYLPTLGYSSSSVVVVTPPSRYLTLIGPATTLYVLPGPTTFSYVLYS